MPDSDTLPDPEHIPYGAQLIKMSSNGKDIFVISDLHLAAGLNSNRNYDGTENFFADYSFVRFLDHLEKKISPTKKGLLVINGDLVDFLRIKNIPVSQRDFETWSKILEDIGLPVPIDTLRSSITAKEVKYGLGTEDYKSIWKLYVCATGHPEFFEKLASWLWNGNELIITKGNHDLEWYWRPVRNYLRYLLAQRISSRQNSKVEDSLANIVNPQTHFVDNRLIIDEQICIEHGHNYEHFTSVDGPPVLKGEKQLNLPFGSFFNRYLINRIELAYPYIDDVRPRKNILALLLRERFPLALQLLFNYIPFVILVIPKKQYSYAFKYLFQFILIVILPLLITVFALYKGFPGFLKSGNPATGSSPGFWQPIFSEAKNLLFLSLSYFIGRLFAMLQLSSPSTLYPNANRIFEEDSRLQLVTFGHTHDPQQIFVEGVSSDKGKRYCNTGTWIPVFEMDAADVRLDRTYTFLHIEKDNAGNIKLPDLFRWNDDALREDPLVLVDRK
jgi:UDP-2,3-diacylglucosamine pyrophosphatase LpxH